MTDAITSLPPVRADARATAATTGSPFVLPPVRADARALLDHLRGHGGLAPKVHSGREVPFDEHRSQTRTGAAPQVMAATRTLALALLRRAGHLTIAAALRTYAARPAGAVAPLLSTGLT